MTAQPAAEQLWLHDTQEQDLVGTDWHQRAIACLFDALQDLAETAGPSRGTFDPALPSFPWESFAQPLASRMTCLSCSGA